jgi:hypothetical protein
MRSVGELLIELVQSGLSDAQKTLVLELAALATSSPPKPSKSAANARYYRARKMKATDSGTESRLNQSLNSGTETTESILIQSSKGGTIGGDLLSLFESEEESQTQGKRVREKTSREAKPKKSRLALNGHQADFDRWYAAYPRREDRLDAERVFARVITTVDIEKLVLAAQAYSVSVAGLDRQKIKLPATWLNKGSYENNLTDATTARRAILSNIQ